MPAGRVVTAAMVRMVQLPARIVQATPAVVVVRVVRAVLVACRLMARLVKVVKAAMVVTVVMARRASESTRMAMARLAGLAVSAGMRAKVERPATAISLPIPVTVVMVAMVVTAVMALTPSIRS